MNQKFQIKKLISKILIKIEYSEKNISELIRGFFINQSRIDDVVEKHKKFNFQIISSVKKFNEFAQN